MSQLRTIGFMGLGTMGANLVQNIAEKGYNVNVFNRTSKKTENLLKLNKERIKGSFSIAELINSIEDERKVIGLMINAGSLIDETVSEIKKFINQGDIIIDFGNSHYKDTERRIIELREQGIHFIGCGVSGGEEGALKGPSIMPSGDREAVEFVLPLLKCISADDFHGMPCVTNVGLGGSGHFVKMVHNGIEYAIMQSITEVYGMCLNENYTNSEILEIFQDINSGQTESFLLDITIEVLKAKDEETDEFLIDLISPQAKAKGTGRWTVESAMEIGVAVPSIAAAVFGRIISSKNFSFENMILHPAELSQMYKPQPQKPVELQMAMEFVFQACYVQGLDLIKQASDEFNWGVDLKEVIRIWQGGCIIRSRMLNTLFETISSPLDFYTNLEHVQNVILQSSSPMPVFNSVIDYALFLSSDYQASRLIQAQRDRFGAHGYKRIDREGDFSGGWS